MEQALPVSCWHCDENYHVRIQETDYYSDARRVFKKIPCPYCKNICVITLKETDIRTMMVTRHHEEDFTEEYFTVDGEISWAQLPAGAFLDQPFPTQKEEE